jgi:tetratricopeptide (TPR) repeat protein
LLELAPERLLYLGLALVLGLFALENLDLGVHLRTGEWIRANGLIHSNVMSFVHHQRPYVDDKWLFQVLLSMGEELLGLSGLVLVRWILVAALALLMLRAAGHGGRHSPVGMVLLGSALLAAHRRFLLRPDFLTLVFVALQMTWILRRQSVRLRWVVVWFFLQALWTNLHGYFVLGPMLFGAALAGHVLQKWVIPETPSRWRDLGGFLIASLLGSLLHAYGWKGTSHPWHILQDLRTNYEFYSTTLVEFLPPFAFQEVRSTDWLCYVLLLSSAVLAVIVRRLRLHGPGFMVALCTGVQSLAMTRNIAVFAVVSGPWLALEAGRFLEEQAARRTLQLRWLLRLLAMAALFLPMAGTLTGNLPLHDREVRRIGWGLNPASYPMEEVDFLAEHDLRERLALPFGMGGYTLWRLKPQRGVLIDGNTAGYPIGYLQWFNDLFGGALDPNAAASQYGIQAYVCEWEQGLSAQLWRDPKWVPVFAGRLAIVFVAKDSRWHARLGDRDLRESVQRGWLPDVTPVEGWLGSRYPAPLRGATIFFLRVGRYNLAERLLDLLPPKFQSLYEFLVLRGQVLFLSGQLGESISVLDRALTRNPRSYAALTLRGEVFIAQREYELAYRDYSRAVRLQPQVADLHRQLGELADFLGRSRMATQHYRNAFAKDPERVDFALTYLRRLCKSTVPGELQEAREELQAILERDDLDDFWRSELEALQNRVGGGE